MANYTDTFHSDRDNRTSHAADVIVSLVCDIIPDIQSAIDVGCGVGTWLIALKKRGVSEILGVDGEWSNKDYLLIPKDRFMEFDLNHPLVLNDKFDLAISLEVAEHIPEQFASVFIDSLVNLSDIILFSAAIPYQGGWNHINEQWPDYWAKLFFQRGYECLDLIRRRIWNEPNIPSWYKQNMLLFVKQHKISTLLLNNDEITRLSGIPQPLVHPDCFLKKTRPLAVRQAFDALKSAAYRAMKEKLS